MTRHVKEKCPSYGKKIFPGTPVTSACEFYEVCKFKGYCVVEKSNRIEQMNLRFRRRIGARYD